MRELHEDPCSGTPICRVVERDHDHGWTTEGMSWPAPGEEPGVKTIILDDKSTAKRATQHWAKEKEAKVGVGVWMWWTDGSHSDNGRVGAAAMFNHGTEWRARCRYLDTGHMDLFDAELWAIGLTLGETVKKRETLQRHGVMTVAVFSNLQAAIRRMAHPEPYSGQQAARRINRRVQALLANCITTEIHWVPGYSGVPRNKEADHQVNLTGEASQNLTIERAYTLASNRAG